MNWGNKIAIFYTIFAVSMISAVIYASRQSFDLVSPTYYDDEIAFDTRIEELKNVKGLSQQLSIKMHIEEQSIEISFPENTSVKSAVKSGLIRLYRPSDAKLDRIFAIDSTRSSQTIFLDTLQKGNWNIQIWWNDGSKNYYVERKLTWVSYISPQKPNSKSEYEQINLINPIFHLSKFLKRKI